MSDKIRKPPVSISELKNEGKPAPKPGGLTYMGGGSGEEGASEEGARAPLVRSTKSKINLTQLVIGVGVSILLFFVISNFTLASKSDAITLLENQKTLEGQQVALEAGLSAESQRIENVIGAQAGWDSQLTSLSSSISNLVNQMTGVGDRITSLETKVATLETKVAAYGNQTEGEVGGSLDYYLSGNRLYVRVSRSGYYIIKVTLVEAFWSGFVATNSTEVVEYYTRSYLLEAGEWIVKGLPGSIVSYLDTHEAFVQVLPGIKGEVEETDEW